MTEVKWIKLSTDIFDNRKIRQIEKLPDGDALVVIWLKLLVLAGNVNDGGAVYFTREIPYTDQLLSTQFDRPLTTVQMALKVFQSFGMIEIIDDLIYISNWEKYQSADKLEQMREANRQRQARFREKRKANLLFEENVTLPNVTDCYAVTHEVTPSNAVDIDKDLEEDKEKEKNKKIVEAWNATGFTKIRGIVPNSKRDRLLKARIKERGEEAVLEAIARAKESSFLAGKNRKGWTITFDWFILPTNFQKVLEGNYDDRRSDDSRRDYGDGQKGSNDFAVHYD